MRAVPLDGELVVGNFGGHPIDLGKQGGDVSGLDIGTLVGGEMIVDQIVG